MPSFTRRAGTVVASLSLGFASAAALADDHPYSEGPVINVARIRTENGKFEDYMKFLDTTFKAEMEAQKKAGLIVDYSVILAEPHNESEPDLLLVTTFKNWAALDGWVTKYDAITKQVEGSMDAASQSAVDRGKIRRVLGSQTYQVLNLK